MRNAAWGGGPVRDEQLPSEMYVGYVRFFRLKEDWAKSKSTVSVRNFGEVIFPMF